MSSNTQISKKANASKMMLWFGIVSLIMTFAGWTSAYIVSSSRADWMQNFQLPPAFWFSTLILLISSVTYWLASGAIRASKQAKGTLLLSVSLLLGIVFVISQFRGFSQMIAYGYYFTGPTSNITLSYVFLISVVHILHVVAGLISLIVVLFNQIRGKYGPDSMLGVELGLTFWNFVDILWLYLIFFFYLYQ
jgi:heme/copper-type cytochrome/quinol oxidase subunit 3